MILQGKIQNQYDKLQREDTLREQFITETSLFERCGIIITFEEWLEIKSMTVQEKIKKEAEGYGTLAPAFIEGAKYALNNQWISVDEDLPCNHKELIQNSTIVCNRETECVIACDDEQNIDFDYMVYYNGKWEWLRNESNTHWFPIPKLPKE